MRFQGSMRQNDDGHISKKKNVYEESKINAAVIMQDVYFYSL